MKKDLEGLRHVSVYLGDHCNFDCTYCDRGYIKSLGGQALGHHFPQRIKEFLDEILPYADDLDMITLHGGEPFLFTKRMDEILTLILPILKKKKLRVGITTNGSLIMDNAWFIEKWSKHIRITLSYDFIYQECNRESFDVEKLVDYLRFKEVPIIWQYVLPIQKRNAFSLDNIVSIVRLVNRSGSNILNLIPLRHHRGEHKFTELLENIDMKQFAGAMIKFINTLYNYNVRVFVDGNSEVVEKSYMENHNKVILSPDGYMYPEYDFCEYKREEFRVGEWHKKIQFYRLQDDSNVIQSKCIECPMRQNCGLKYLHKMFGTEPGDKCVQFYNIIEGLVTYTHILYEKNNFYEWVHEAAFPVRLEQKRTSKEDN